MSLKEIKISAEDKKLFFLMLYQKFLTLDLADAYTSKEMMDDSNHKKRPKIYFRLNRMIKNNLVFKKKINELTCYFLSKLGYKYIELECKYSMPLYVQTPDDEKCVYHDYIVAYVRRYIEANGGEDWISDRIFRVHMAKERPIRKYQSFQQIPDGAFTYHNNVYFIEVELTQKSKTRYDSIYEYYSSKQNSNVIYFYKDESVVKYMKELSANSNQFYFFEIPELLSDECTIFDHLAEKKT